ncbi:MAG: DUF6702 family protein [Catalinimonas sp.]
MRHPLLFVITALLAVWPLAAHEFHASLAEVHYNAEARTYEVSLRVFTDDLLTDLRAHAGGEVPEPLTAASELLCEYLRPRFQLFDAESVPVPLTFLGAENDVDVTWLYFQFEAAAEQVTQLRNAVLADRFDDQSNLVNVTVAGKRRSYLLRPTNPTTDL